jgi:CheY-like chemotaxis protein
LALVCVQRYHPAIQTIKAAESMLNEVPIPTRRILVIEDNTDSAETIKVLLELGGHSVDIAFSGEEGIRKARELKPDVVLCDIGLPGGVDGYDVARALRGEPQLTLIALTGFGERDDKRRAAEAGFHSHINKPVDPDVLENLINNLPARP